MRHVCDIKMTQILVKSMYSNKSKNGSKPCKSKL
nr:MAG TPA: hypothetical protein [Bacteriophage sp.]